MHRPFSLSTVLLAMVLSFAALLRAQAPQPVLLQQADVLGADLFAKSGSTGMVMVVVRGHEVYFRGFGETAPGSGQAPTQNSLIRLCSLSKIFATDLLTKLIADHTVVLDDPLQKFAPPRVLVPSRGRRDITLKDLATHTSGLPREVGRAPAGTAHFTFPDYAFRWRWLPRQVLKTTPGTAALYSNVGFDFLGDSLEHAAGKPYATLFAERTTVPLGMRETGFTPNPNQCARLLRGVHDEGPCTDTQMSAASAGVYSTATDMTLWLKYLLGTGAPALPTQDLSAQAIYVNPSDLVSQSGLDHPGAPSGIGLGWMHLSVPDGVVGPDGATGLADITQKTGGGAGFVTYIALNQARHAGIFVAFTDAAVPTHYNVFKGANNVLYALIGLPEIPVEIPKPAAKPAAKRPRRRTAH